MNELVRIPEFTDFEGKLTEFRERYDNVVYDLDDPKQNRQARADKFAIGKVVAKLDRAHKTLKGPLLDQVRLIDGERKHIKDDLLGIQGRIKSQLEEHEAKKIAAEKAVQKRIDAILLLAEFDETPGSGELHERISVLKTIVPEAAEYAPRQGDAALACRLVAQTLTDMLAQRIEHEKEQAEIQRLREEEKARERQEREDRIRRESEERIKWEAEALAHKAAKEAKRREQAIRDEKERAIREKEEAEARAKQQQEKAALREKELKEKAARDKAEAEKRAQQAAKEAAERAVQAERDRLLAEQHQREAKASGQKHRSDIEAKIAADFVLMESDEDLTPRSIVAAIKAGKIRHVRIVY